MPATKVISNSKTVIHKKYRQAINFKLDRRKKWPEDYIGSQKDIWGKIGIVSYLQQEGNLWQ